MLSLIIDGGVPTPGADAGSAANMDLARGLKRLGHAVHYFPDGRVAGGGDLATLAEFAVPGRPFAGPMGLAPWLAEHGERIDFVIVCRPGPAAKYLPLFERYMRLRRIYFGHDVHYLRMRTGQSAGVPHAPLQLRAMEALERRIWRTCDLVVYPSADECGEVRARETSARALAIPIYALDVAEADAAEPRPGRRDGLFVGGAAHAPNRDAVAWFADAVLPIVRLRIPAFTLYVAGAWPESLAAPLRRDGLVFLGPLSEAALAERVGQARMSLAPLRFGAGVKRKVVAAFAAGLPVVSTPSGVEGLAPDSLEAPLALVARDAAEFASCMLRLAADDGLWRHLAAAGLKFCRMHYSEAGYDAGLRRMLSAASRV